MTIEIDCRGMSCPQPVISTKKALEETEGDQIKVIVDNQNALQNVKRFVSSRGCRVETQERKGDYILTVIKEKECSPSSGGANGYIVLIASDTLGSGDDKLGRILLKSFLNTLWQKDSKPEKILFLNSAVKLACKESEMLDVLQLLEDAGVNIVSCGTCLAYYEITELLSVGYAGNMLEVVDSLLDTDRIIRI